MTKTDKFLFCLFLLLIFLSGFPFFDGIKLYLFCVPSGFVVQVLSGGTFRMDPGSVTLLWDGAEILMPPSCSGMTFFLLTALLFFFYGKWKWAWISYPFALLINGVRVLAVSAWTLRMEKQIPLPGPLQHQTVGLMIFLTSLLLLSAVIHLSFGCKIENNPEKTDEKNEQSS